MKKLSRWRKFYLDRKSRRGFSKKQYCRFKKKHPHFLSTIHQSCWTAPAIFGIVDPSHRGVFLNAIANLRLFLQNPPADAVLDFSKVKILYPEATLLFWAELSHLMQSKKVGLEVGCIVPKQQRSRDALQQIGVFELLNHQIDSIATHNDAIHWRVSHGHDVAGAEYETILQPYDGEIALPLQEGLYTGITEAMTNVANHAYILKRQLKDVSTPKNKDWWMFSEHKGNTLTVVFADLGAGIPITLPVKRPDVWTKIKQTLQKGRGKFGKRQKRKSDADAIEAAVKDSVTRTRMDNRGKGLGQIMHAVATAKNHHIAIHSNYGTYGNKLKSNHIDSINATIISWQIDLQGGAT